ncbi:hypothetical protein D3C71_1952670 [compost metagenome]
MTCSCAIRDAMSPRRMPASIVDVNNGISAMVETVELPYFVNEIVVAPFSLAHLSASIVSWVSPECEIAIATSPGVRFEADMICRCESALYRVLLPTRPSL